MNDLISRQAAIDALGEEPEVFIGNEEYEQGLNNQWHYDVNALKALPSAQQWIPCSERLPEKDGYYLTTTCYRQVYNDFWSEDHFDRTEAVIAWMPLPEPYKGDNP